LRCRWRVLLGASDTEPEVWLRSHPVPQHTRSVPAT
jgi:hypothetical protein